MSTGFAVMPGTPLKIDQTSFQIPIGILLGIALIVATGRIVIRARTYKSNGFTIDDGFFLLAVMAYLAGTVIIYVDVPYFYTEENVASGLELPPSDFIPYLIYGEKLEDALLSLIGVAIVSVKFSFLFFFRALLRQQRKMMIWWWCNVAFLVPTAVIMIFGFFITCAYWNEDIIVKCVSPGAYMRQNGTLKALTILDIFTDAGLISIPVLLLWNVQISLRRKLALGTILCLSICTIIIAIIKVAGGRLSNGGVDTAWVNFWYDIEAAIAIIVVSVTAFRALFIAHKAMKYRSPAENAPSSSSSSTSWNFWSRKTKGSRSKEPPPLPSPPAPPPVLGAVRTHIRGSQYGGTGSNRDADYMELPLHGPGITVTQVVHSEKTPAHFTRPSAESFV